MRRAFLAAFIVLTAAAQTKIDLRTQAKSVDFTAATATKPVKTGTALPGVCTVGEMFFKTDAPAGANLYGCTSADTWSVQSGTPSQDCWYDSTDGTLKCRDAGGNIYAAVKTSSGPTPNQWVDYISPAGIPHTSQPNAAAVGALADSGTNGIPYRSGPGTTSLAGADNLSAVFSCQDVGALNAYACNLTPPISAYTAGTSYSFKANSANTGSATINFNGLGTKLIVKQVTQQLTAGDIKAGQWVIITYDGVVMQMQSQTANPGSGAVASVFGRSGSVTAQSGDYAFSQISGAVATGQLPPTVMRADSDNTVTGGTQDMRGANHTLPMKSGLTAALPATCQAGEAYFATDAPAGNNVYGCTAANTWSSQGANLTVASQGTVIGSRPKVNFQTGPGLLSVISDSGSQIDILWALDTAVNQTQPGEQSGSALLCASASGSNRNYQCSLTPTLGAYTSGMTLHWKPDVNGAGGTTTLNVDTLGAMPIKLHDGASDPAATDIVAGQLYDIWYDGAHFRLLNQNTIGAATALAAQYIDWNASSGGASIANKPTIPSIASTNSVLKGNGSGNAVAATSGTDYAPATSGTAPLKGNGAGGTSAAAYSDIVGLWTACSGYLKSSGTCDTPGGGGSATSYADVFDGSTTTLADGTTVSWSTVGSQYQASWTVPAGVHQVHVLLWGSGGGGSPGASWRSGSGGGGGGFFDTVCSVTPGGSVTVSVGIGGAAGYSNNGASSSFGTCVTVQGGYGSAGSVSGTGGGIVLPGGGVLWGAYIGSGHGFMAAGSSGCVGTDTGGDSQRVDLGGCGGGYTGGTAAGYAGGNASAGGGGGGGGATNNATGGPGGLSGLGGAGATGGYWSSGCHDAGVAGTPGGGGGGGAYDGGSTGCNGSAGARGEVRVFYAK